ncbi:hypothetical protein BGX38DRAFT_522248 [Terfezia claveryi]|nr:hypothetical protein BGX38DRAFT_522248 [Terfezia claveryi]
MKPTPNPIVTATQSATVACRIRLWLPSSLIPNKLLFPCQAVDDTLSLCGGLSSDLEPPSTAGGRSLAKGNGIFGMVVGIEMASFGMVILRSTTAPARYLVRFTTASSGSYSLKSYLAELEMLYYNLRIPDNRTQMPLRYCQWCQSILNSMPSVKKSRDPTLRGHTILRR